MLKNLEDLRMFFWIAFKMLKKDFYKDFKGPRNTIKRKRFSVIPD